MNSKRDDISIEEWRRKVDEGYFIKKHEEYLANRKFNSPLLKYSDDDKVMMLEALQVGIPAFILFQQIGLTETRSEARRLIKQGGAYCNSKRIEHFDMHINDSYIIDNEITLAAGKKRRVKLVIR